MKNTKKDAEKFLSPYIPVLTKIFKQAINEYKSDPQKIFYCTRTKACVINCLLHKHALIELGTDKGIRFVYKNGNTYVVIRNRFNCRLKKLDNKLRTSNIPTRQSEKFLFQQPALWDESDIPPPLTNIFAGYTWDVHQNHYSGLFITCPKGKTNEWYIDLASIQQPMAEILPFKTPDNTNKRRRAKPRKAEKNDEVDSER